MFKFEPLISQVVLVGDRLPHLVALFTIHPPIAESIRGAGSPGIPLHESPEVLAEMQKIVTRVNKQLAPFEQVKRFRILHREFTIEHGEVTATMKVRRKQVLGTSADVDALYRVAASDAAGSRTEDTGTVMTLSDTSPGAREVYFRRAATRRMYPDADEAEINFRIAVTRFGAELARKAYRRQ